MKLEAPFAAAAQFRRWGGLPSDTNRLKQPGRTLRQVREEVEELAAAVEAIPAARSHEEALGMLGAVTHELADVIYSCYVAASEWDLPIQEMLYEVHAANMRKLRFDLAGNVTVLTDEDGKIRKPDDWKPVDDKRVMRRWFK